jgi:hypothetical protein
MSAIISTDGQNVQRTVLAERAASAALSPETWWSREPVGEPRPTPKSG